MEDDDLLEELQERIAEGPILFTPDDDWVEQLNEEEWKNFYFYQLLYY